MATCKDCLHYEVCVIVDSSESTDEDYLTEFGCDDFKDRSKWVEQKHGRWELTAHEESCNYRWNVTAACSECRHDKGEIYAGFFTGFPRDLAESVVLDCAASVKLDRVCTNCGAYMRKGSVGE